MKSDRWRGILLDEPEDVIRARGPVYSTALLRL